MDLYLQFGWGMKSLVLDFSKNWDSTSVILSPRDISPEQLIKWRKDFDAHGVKTLFDPQCYYPKSHHNRLSKYDYWNSSMTTNLGSIDNYETTLIKSIDKYNEAVNTESFIIPSTMANYDEKWFSKWKMQAEKLSVASRQVVSKKEILLTLALPSNLLIQKEIEIERIIEFTSRLDVDGYYIIAEPVDGEYCVENPLWMSNLMQLCGGLKMQNRKIIVGYSNQQMLSLSSAKVDAIASGTFLNVRKFSNKFEEGERNIKRRSVWYYYPEALSEYKLQFMDVAYSRGVLDEMKSTVELRNEYIDLIFSGIMPSTTRFNETFAFKHYLESLRKQAKICSRASYKETMAANEMLLQTAERRIEYLERNGVYAQARSFRECIDVNRSALNRLNEGRGFMLQHSWSEL